MEFEWGDASDQANKREYCVSFDIAKRALDWQQLTSCDHRKDHGEDRYVSIGQVGDEALIVIAHTRREGRIRLISARPASRKKKSRGAVMKYSKPLTSGQIAGTQDKSIDFGDIPELDETFWREAELVEPDRTEQITMRVKRSVLEHFRASGKGYQTRMNRVLESYVQAHRDSG